MADQKNLMAGTWTKAATVRRAFKAGPPRKKDLLYDVEEAALQGYITLLKVRTEMVKAGINSAGAVKAALVLMTSDESAVGCVSLLSIPRTIKTLPELVARAAYVAKKAGMVPLGVAFWQKDAEADGKNGRAVWVQSWLVNPRAARAAIEARTAFESTDGEETDSTFN